VTESDLDDDGEFADIRELLAGAPLVEPREGALERIVAAVAAQAGSVGAVVDLGARRDSRAQRWAPRVAAAAVIITIIGAVVGGIGSDTRIPAIGDLVASHQAAAAGQMPETADEMTMHDAYHLKVGMPESMKMQAAFTESGKTIHLLYAGPDGEMVSLFWQPGETDLRELGDDGQLKMMGGSPVWSSVVGESHVAVVDGVGCVWTLVSDHEDDAMLTSLTHDLPAYGPSWSQRVVDMADEIVDPWRLGG
jgi:hypothetical protein